MQIGIIMILTSVLVPLAMISLGLSGRKKVDTIFKPSNSLLYIAIFGLAAFVGFDILGLVQLYVWEIEYDFWLYICLRVFHMLGIWLIMFWALWRVELKDEYLYYRNSFGIVKKTPYSEINKVVEERERDGNALRGYVVHYGNKKSFFIEFLIVGSEGFLNALKKKMRAHGCKLDTEIKPVGFAPKKKK
jgi:hypothetical protein